LDEFEAALTALLPRLRRFAHALTHEPAEADDLVRQTAEHVLRSHGQWRSDIGFDVWSYRVMRRLRAGMAAGSGRRDRVRTQPRAGGMAEARAEAQSAADLRLLMRALHRLPGEQREAVALVLIEGLSYAKAAAVLEVRVDTLVGRLVGGRRALVAMLEAE
jgi:RNA polymerase sigma factor (sigma-70 family)